MCATPPPHPVHSFRVGALACQPDPLLPPPPTPLPRDLPEPLPSPTPVVGCALADVFTNFERQCAARPRAGNPFPDRHGPARLVLPRPLPDALLGGLPSSMRLLCHCTGLPSPVADHLSTTSQKMLLLLRIHENVENKNVEENIINILNKCWTEKCCQHSEKMLQEKMLSTF